MSDVFLSWIGVEGGVEKWISQTHALCTKQTQQPLYSHNASSRDPISLNLTFYHPHIVDNSWTLTFALPSTRYPPISLCSSHSPLSTPPRSSCTWLRILLTLGTFYPPYLLSGLPGPAHTLTLFLISLFLFFIQCCPCIDMPICTLFPTTPAPFNFPFRAQVHLFNGTQSFNFWICPRYAYTHKRTCSYRVRVRVRSDPIECVWLLASVFYVFFSCFTSE